MHEVYAPLFNEMAKLQGLEPPSDYDSILKVGEKMIEDINGHKKNWKDQEKLMLDDIEIRDNVIEKKNEAIESLISENNILKTLILTLVHGHQLPKASKDTIEDLAKGFGISFGTKNGKPYLLINGH